MKESTPPVLKVSLPEAEELLQAEALEAHPPMGWSAAESNAASRDALAVAGKSDIQAFLLTRAKLVLSRMTKHDPSLKRPRLPQTGWLIKIISLGIVFLGFFSGAVTDQLTSAGAQLNLLSPPLLTVFAWNILAMLAAIAGLAISFRRSTSPAGLSTALARILGSAAHVMRFVAIGKPADKTYFNKLLSLLLPQTAWRFRAVLHWAALAFGIGLAASLLVRGIGTAYWLSGKVHGLPTSPMLLLPFFKDCMVGCRISSQASHRCRMLLHSLRCELTALPQVRQRFLPEHHGWPA